MDAPIFATSPGLRLPDAQPPGPPPDAAVLLRHLLDAQREQLAVLKAQHVSSENNAAAAARQLIELQKEQLAVLKAQQAANDSASRWRAFLARWAEEFPNVGQSTRAVLPLIERAYLAMIQELADKLRDEEAELGNEFGLGEFLDRYGVRLSQLGSILSQLGPIADAAPPDPERDPERPS